MAIFRRRSQNNGQCYRLVRPYGTRFIPGRRMNRRYRYFTDRSRLEREILAYYYQIDRLHQWIKNSRKVFCTLVFVICTLRLMTSFSRLYVFLLKLAIWSNVVALLSSVLLLCVLHHRTEVLNGRIKRAWKRLTQRPRNFNFHLY